MSKVTLPLLEFSVAKLQGESNDHFLVMVEIGVENVVGSYGRAEHDAYLKALSNEGQLSRVLEKAGVAYGPCPEPSTEASAEATKKRKVNACVRLVGKRVKVVRKKKVAATPKGTVVLKAAVAPKGMTTTMLKTIFAPLKAATPKVVAPKVAATKVATLVVLSTVGGATTSKVATAGQKGAPGATKAGVLKIKSGMKRPTRAEPSSVKTTKQLKAAKALSSAPTSTKKVAVPSLHAHGSDDDHIEICSMLGVSSTTSSSSSSSSDSSASKSA
jgi:hypothetical protein